MSGPPKLARRLLEWVAGSANVDDLLGDVDELFFINSAQMPLWRAKARYWRNVLSLSFSYALRKRRRDSKHSICSSSNFSFDMIRSYVKVAWRNLLQYRYFSLLNIFGLAIGMSVSLLVISLYTFVRTYDNFHKNGERIYTIMSTQRDGVEQLSYATAPLALADRIEDEVSAVKKVVRIVRANDLMIKNNKEDLGVNSYFVEPEFLSVFTFPLVQGSAASLANPGQVMLTESAAEKLFNSLDVVGKNIELASGMNLQVAGLMKDAPRNSHLDFDMLISLSSLPRNNLPVADQWTKYNEQYIYLLLADNTSSEQLQSYLDSVADMMYKNSPIKVFFGTQQLHNIVMGPDLIRAIGKTWDIGGFIIFGVFAALILLPACFNYTNISIARALRRTKEIGLRKTMGGVRGQLFFQFITETIVITLVALVGSLLIFVIIRDEFQSMLVAGASLDLSITWQMGVAFVLFAVFTGFVAGIFPALYFAGLNPIEALKNKISGRGSSMKIRKGLTVFQFVLSFGFILALVVFGRQYQYSLDFNFGFQKENIVDVQLKDVDPDLFKSKFSQLAAVKSISMSSGIPGVQTTQTFLKTSGTDSVEVDQMFIDDNFIANFKLQLIAGNNFPDKVSTEEKFMIVNEEFLNLEQIKSPGEVLGKTYTIDGHDLEVIGVVKNFHYAPLHYPIGRLCLRANKNHYVYANLQVASRNPLEMFTEMEAIWKTFSTEKKFEAQYFEHELNDAFSTYKVLLKMVGFLGVLAITISLLGMLGMVVYTSETKTKEVSIRKVMGATVGSIAVLLSKDYMKLMAIAIAVSIPATTFLLNALLPSLQYYHVDITVWDVLLSMFVLVFLGLVTIASQTYKTATTNPATTLRGE